MEAVSTELFATKQEIQTLLAGNLLKEDSEVKEKEDEDPENGNQGNKGKVPALYDEGEVKLSDCLSNDEYIKVGQHQVSRFDITRLEAGMFANADVLNAYMDSIARQNENVSSNIYLLTHFSDILSVATIFYATLSNTQDFFRTKRSECCQIVIIHSHSMVCTSFCTT